MSSETIKIYRKALKTLIKYISQEIVVRDYFKQKEKKIGATRLRVAPIFYLRNDPSSATIACISLGLNESRFITISYKYSKSS